MTGNERFPRPGEFRAEPVIQGEFKVSKDPKVVFSTVLGSCVSVALHDPKHKVGGLNHYLLPEGTSATAGDVKFGAFAIELLINALLKSGAVRRRLEARLYGGANIVARLGDIGARNAEFARSFMRREGFAIVQESLGGSKARRLQFHPSSGATKLLQIGSQEGATLARSENLPPPRPTSDVTLF